MASRDRTLMRLDKAVRRLERALDVSQDAREGVAQEDLGGAGQGVKELEERLKTADARLGSVISELKTMLERGDASGDGTDQRS